MESQGLIARIPSEKDQRKVMITLTGKGKSMQEKAAQIPFKLLKKLQIEEGTEQMEKLISLRTQINELIKILKATENIE